MSIFGTRNVKSTRSRGQFHCPQCDADKDYEHKRVTKYFTLYVLPIIPLSRLAEYVECQDCKGTFVPKILAGKSDLTEEEAQAQYEIAMRHCLALIVRADGQIDEQELSMLYKIINKFGHRKLTYEAIEEYVTNFDDEEETVATYLKKVTPSLNRHGKEVILKCALAIAAADGDVDPSELDIIDEMAHLMEMSDDHIQQILREMASELEAGI